MSRIDTAQFAWLFWWTLGVSLGLCVVAAILTVVLDEHTLTRLRDRWCAWRGHDFEFRVDPGRVWLRCTTCGYRSPGLIV